jgi:hypothetical protein
VVYDGWKSGLACQFSFACDGSLARPPTAGRYRDALDIAAQALAGHVEPEVGLATHYHAITVDPWWRGAMVRIAQIGSQIFYRWPGEAGRAGAFTGRYAGGEQVPLTADLLARAASNPNPRAPPPLATSEPTASAPSPADPAVYRLGRRVRPPAELREMNQWLEVHRPLTNASGGPSA